MTAPESDSPVIVVGAGVSGLVAARELHRLGLPVTVLEVADRIGGKLASRRTEDGFTIDRGFQIVLSAYPALARHVDLDALGAGAFARGAAVATDSGVQFLDDPLGHPTAAVRDLRTDLFGTADKLRLVRLAVDVARQGWTSAAQAANEMDADLSILQYLKREGFSNDFIDRFARPFWGGITLDRDLGASAGVFRFTLKMFLTGRGVLPRDGIAAIPAALAATLPEGTIETGVTVTGLTVTDGAVTGVETAQGRRPAAAVVIATDAAAARELTGFDVIPTETVGCVSVMLATETDSGIGTRLLLNARDGWLNHLAPLSAVQPSYAPTGQHLLAAVIVDQDALTADDEAVSARILAEVEAILPGLAPRVIAIERVPQSLFVQAPGIHRVLPDAITGVPGLVLGGDITVDASLNGVVLAGEAAARAVRSLLPHVATHTG